MWCCRSERQVLARGQRGGVVRQRRAAALPPGAARAHAPRHPRARQLPRRRQERELPPRRARAVASHALGVLTRTPPPRITPPPSRPSSSDPPIPPLPRGFLAGRALARIVRVVCQIL